MVDENRIIKDEPWWQPESKPGKTITYMVSGHHGVLLPALKDGTFRQRQCICQLVMSLDSRSDPGPILGSRRPKKKTEEPMEVYTNKSVR